MYLLEHIRDCADEVLFLTEDIAPLQTAPAALIANQATIFETKGQLLARTAILAKLQSRSKVEFEAFSQLGGSLTKRIMLRASSIGRKGGGLVARREEAERRYTEAFDKESAEADNVTALEKKLHDAEAAKTYLLAQKERYDTLTARLEQMLSALFDGATPEFPKEDEAELQVAILVETARLVQNEIGREKRAREYLQEAQSPMNACTKALQTALQLCIDTGIPQNQKYTKQVLKGGSFRTAARGTAPFVLNAKTYAGRLHTLVAQARGMQLQVKGLPKFEIIELHLMPGHKSKNAVDEQGLHRSLEASYAQARMCASSLRTEITTSFTRQRNLRAQVGELGQRILEARQNLTDLRTGIVRSVADGTALPSVGVPDAANGAPTDEKKSAAGAGFGLGPGAGQLGYGVTPMQDAIKTGAHKKLRGILRTAGASEDEIEEELSHLY